MCMVVNKYKEEYDIYIGRGSVWGNPFPIIEGKQSREDVIEMYRKYIWDKIKKGDINVDQLLSLKGKRLGCFCKPKACHGDVLVKAVEWAESRSEK